MDRLRSRGQDGRVFKGVKLAAIGPATARKLEDFGLKIDLVPRDYRAESLIEGLKKEKISGVRILIPRAKEAREVLPESLKSLGAKVDVATAYQTVIDDSKVIKFKEILLGKKVEVITFTSSSTVKNFVKLLKGVDLSHVLSGVQIACIGPITAQTVRDEGLKVDLVAKEYTIPGLVEALIKRK
jgi:uroporphyrinogen III methyltransferase/synthase